MSMGRTAPTSIGGRAVGPVWFGTLGLTIPWAPVDYPVAVKVMKTALEQGANFWNGGIHYGTPQANSLHLLKHYFGKYPEDASKVVLSIKGAYDMKTGPNGSPEAIRASAEEAVKTIDILNAHAVHPILAVEIELSLSTPDPLINGVADACHELGIAIVAYSPISRGWLTGEIRKPDDIPHSDFHRILPRFQPDVFEQNFKLVEAVEQIAKRKGVTTAQVAIGWVCHRGAIPIPGSTKVERVVENSKAASLTDQDMAELQKILDTLLISG
ncbi:Pyridoxine 4-dehydrogenase [Xylographa carneopallida]|nr:Pyridoxine 4-dehydrogenase [Xylographa carneopallida]